MKLCSGFGGLAEFAEALVEHYLLEPHRHHVTFEGVRRSNAIPVWLVHAAVVSYSSESQSWLADAFSGLWWIAGLCTCVLDKV